MTSSPFSAHPRSRPIFAPAPPDTLGKRQGWLATWHHYSAGIGRTVARYPDSLLDYLVSLPRYTPSLVKFVNHAVVLVCNLCQFAAPFILRVARLLPRIHVEQGFNLRPDKACQDRRLQGIQLPTLFAELSDVTSKPTVGLLGWVGR